MMTPMLAACPTFVPAWQEFLDQTAYYAKEYGSDDAPPIYEVLSEFAEHLIYKLERGEAQDFPAIVEVVESWLAGDDYEIGSAAVVGLIEALALYRYKTIAPDSMRSRLGPLGQKWWVEVIDFWDRLKAGRFRPLSIDPEAIQRWEERPLSG